MEVKIELPAEAVAEDLLWHADQTDCSKKLRKALHRVAAYFMNYEDCVKYFGKKKTREYWDEC